MELKLFYPNSRHPITIDQFKQLCLRDRISIIQQWFYNHYEDPSEILPYESVEGGYQWIYGAGRETYEALSEVFEDLATEPVLKVVAQYIEEDSNDCYEWSPIPPEEVSAMERSFNPEDI